MPQKEQRIEQVKNKIAELKKSKIGWIMLFIGALIMTGAIYGGEILLGFFGFIIIIFILI